MTTAADQRQRAAQCQCNMATSGVGREDRGQGSRNGLVAPRSPLGP